MLRIHEGASFDNMQVLDVDAQTYFKEDSANPLDRVKPFYYTSVLPKIPDSFLERIEQEFFLLHEGSNLLLMRDDLEFETYKSNALQQISKHQLYEYQAKLFYQMSSIPVETLVTHTSISEAKFGDFKLAIANDIHVIQTYDGSSSLQITMLPNAQLPIQSNFTLADSSEVYPYSFTALEGGYFSIPEMRVESLPGSNVTI